MRRYRVVVGPKAERDLRRLEHYIAGQGRPRTAASYVGRILRYLETLKHSPHRGLLRDDLGPGLRVTNFEGRLSILFSVEDDRVVIVRVAYGGRPIEALSADSSD